MFVSSFFWLTTRYSTVPGKNDEQNVATITAVGPILKAVKPATFASEQVPGFLIKEKHRPYFRMYINTILNASYNVRWEIQNMAWHGLAQHRTRLLFVGAKYTVFVPHEAVRLY